MAERLTAVVAMAGSAGALQVMFDQVRRLVEWYMRVKQAG